VVDGGREGHGRTSDGRLDVAAMPDGLATLARADQVIRLDHGRVVG
jgi:hypothetical protein